MAEVPLATAIIFLMAAAGTEKIASHVLMQKKRLQMSVMTHH